MYTYTLYGIYRFFIAIDDMLVFYVGNIIHCIVYIDYTFTYICIYSDLDPFDPMKKQQLDKLKISIHSRLPWVDHVVIAFCMS